MIETDVGYFSTVAARAELAEMRTFSNGNTTSFKSSFDTLGEMINFPSSHTLKRKF